MWFLVTVTILEAYASALLYAFNVVSCCSLICRTRSYYFLLSDYPTPPKTSSTRPRPSRARRLSGVSQDRHPQAPRKLTTRMSNVASGKLEVPHAIASAKADSPADERPPSPAAGQHDSSEHELRPDNNMHTMTPDSASSSSDSVPASRRDGRRGTSALRNRSSSCSTADSSSPDSTSSDQSSSSSQSSSSTAESNSKPEPESLSSRALPAESATRSRVQSAHKQADIDRHFNLTLAKPLIEKSSKNNSKQEQDTKRDSARGD